MAPVEVSGTWRTTAGPQAVWEVLSDLDRWRDWWPALSQVRVRASGEGDLPSAAELVFSTVVGPLTVPVVVRVAEPPVRLVVASDGGGFDGEATLSIREDEDGAEIAYGFRARAKKLWLRPVEAVLSGVGRSAGRQRMREAGDRLAELAGGEPRRHDV